MDAKLEALREAQSACVEERSDQAIWCRQALKYRLNLRARKHNPIDLPKLAAQNMAVKAAGARLYLLADLRHAGRGTVRSFCPLPSCTVSSPESISGEAEYFVGISESWSNPADLCGEREGSLETSDQQKKERTATPR